MTGDGFVFGIIPKGTDINEIDNWKRGYATCSCNFAEFGRMDRICKASSKRTKYYWNYCWSIDRGELSFSINGKNLGIFCNNIIKDIEYVPFIDIHKEEIEIILVQ